MNITEKLQRIVDLRNRIRLKLAVWGIAQSTDKMESLTAAIENLENCGAVNQTLDGTKTTYTVPKGYHNGLGKVSITTESKSATPTKSTQNITPSSGKVLFDVTIEPIPDAYQDVTPVTAGAADVLTGKKIVASTGEVIDGAIPVNGDVSATIDGLTNTSYTVPAGHTAGGTVSLTDDIENALEAIVGGENTGIQSELASLAESKAAIAEAIEEKNVTVPSGTKLDGMAALIGQIETGGGAEMISGQVSTGADMFTVHYTDESGYHMSETFVQQFTCVKDSLILVEGVYYGNTMTGAEIVYSHTYEEYVPVIDAYETFADMLIRIKDDGFTIYV